MVNKDSKRGNKEQFKEKKNIVYPSVIGFLKKKIKYENESEIINNLNLITFFNF